MIHLHTIRSTSSFEGSSVITNKVSSDFMRTPYWFHSTNYVLVSSGLLPPANMLVAPNPVNPAKAAYFSNI